MIEALPIEQDQVIAFPETQDFPQMSRRTAGHHHFCTFFQGRRMEYSGIHDSIISHAGAGCQN
jgi:hypothetical protein